MIPDVPVQAPPLVVNQLHSEEHGLVENELIAHASHELLSIKTHSYQFTYFIYYSYQDKFKNSRIIKIHQVHQKLSTKQV